MLAYIGTWATAIEHREDQVSQVASGCHFPRESLPRKIDDNAGSHGSNRFGECGRANVRTPRQNPRLDFSHSKRVFGEMWFYHFVLLDHTG